MEICNGQSGRDKQVRLKTELSKVSSKNKVGSRQDSSKDNVVKVLESDCKKTFAVPVTIHNNIKGVFL